MFEEPHRYCDQQCAHCPLERSCVAREERVVETAAPIVLDRGRLRTAAMAHATATLSALQTAVDRGRLEPLVASAVVADAFAVAACVGRIVGVFGERAIPHLLVVERLLHRVDAAILSYEALLEPTTLNTQRQKRWEVGRRLDPQMRAIQPEHRRALTQLVHRGQAPSPLVRVVPRVVQGEHAAPQLSGGGSTFPSRRASDFR